MSEDGTQMAEINFNFRKVIDNVVLNPNDDIVLVDGSDVVTLTLPLTLNRRDKTNFLNIKNASSLYPVILLTKDESDSFYNGGRRFILYPTKSAQLYSAAGSWIQF